MSSKELENFKRKFDSDDDHDDDDDDKWSKLSREQIIQRCKQLEKHIEQLKCTINKTPEKESNKKKAKKMRPFDFNKHPKRHIFLKFIYLGWDYHVRIINQTKRSINERTKRKLCSIILGLCSTRNNITDSRRFFIQCTY